MSSRVPRSLAASTVSKTGITSAKRLIAKISSTILLRAATAIRRSFGFAFDAAINARSPALEIYATSEKSTTTSAAPARDRPQYKKTVATPFTDFHAPPPTGR
jgi:hypothetical protein